MTTKLKPHDLRRAADLAVEIERLEKLRDAAEDTTATVAVGPMSYAQGVGVSQFAQALQLAVGGPAQAAPAPTPPMPNEIRVPIAASAIRAALVEKLAPLYDQLRRLGIELDLS